MPRRRPQDRHDPRLCAVAARRISRGGGLIPGTKPMEDRDRDLLARQVLADLLVDWQEPRRTEMLDALAELSACAWAPTGCEAG